MSQGASYNKLIVEAYKKEALRSKEKNGFAFVDQKLTLKGLTVLVGAYISKGTADYDYISPGHIAYIKEEALHTQQWAQKVYESDGVSSPFIIVDLAFVEFIAPPKKS